jgi:hypothetical protein
MSNGWRRRRGTRASHRILALAMATTEYFERKTPMAQPNSNEVLMSRREAADYLGVAPRTLAIWKTTKRYPLPVVKIGRLAKYRKCDLDEFIRIRTV